MEKRLKFECWKCSRIYTLLREITKEQILTVACPYCNAEAVVNLKRYRSSISGVMREGNPNDAQSPGEELRLPDILPTQESESGE